LELATTLIGTLLAQPDAAEPAGPGSVLELMRRGGLMMVPILVCSLLAAAVAMERMAVLRRPRVIPRALVRGFEQLAPSGRGARRDALDLCRAHDSPAARVLAAGVDKLGHRPEIVEKHMAAAGEHEVFMLRRRLRALVVVTSVAPLLGLTGTILGMIKAFQTVAASGEALGRAELLAQGIYEAMITTAAGLLVAMPTLVLYHWLSGKIERLTRDLDRLAVSFVERHVLEPIDAGPAYETDHPLTDEGDDGFGASPASAGGIGA
jgi:biopolymer transport protein ExbB